MKYEYESNDDRIDELRRLAEMMMDVPADSETQSLPRPRARSDEFDFLPASAAQGQHAHSSGN